MTNKEINDFLLKTAPAGTDEIVLQETGGGVTKKTTLNLLHQSKVGFFDYNDLATATTPQVHPGTGGYIKLTNDTLGGNTTTAYRPLGMTTLWNATNDQFDFTELSIGDMVDIRVDVEVTTTAVNQDVKLQVELSIGSGAFTIELDFSSPKAAGTYKFVSYTGIYIGSAAIRDNPGEIQLDSDSSANIKINGWYLKVTRR